MKLPVAARVYVGGVSAALTVVIVGLWLFLLGSLVLRLG